MSVPRPAPYKGMRSGPGGGACAGSVPPPRVPSPGRPFTNGRGALGPPRAPAFVCGGRWGQWGRGRGEGRANGRAGRGEGWGWPGHVRAESPPGPGTPNSPGTCRVRAGPAVPFPLSREDRARRLPQAVLHGAATPPSLLRQGPAQWFCRQPKLRHGAPGSPPRPRSHAREGP